VNNPYFKRPGRFSVVCIPGNAEDGSDSWWYVFDRRSRKDAWREVGCGDKSRGEALRLARELNRGAGK
jgi:hypothetical protein